MCQTYWADKPDSDSDLLIILVLAAGCSVLENTDPVYETKLPFCSFEIHRLTLSAKLCRIYGGSIGRNEIHIHNRVFIFISVTLVKTMVIMFVTV